MSRTYAPETVVCGVAVDDESAIVPVKKVVGISAAFMVVGLIVSVSQMVDVGLLEAFTFSMLLSLSVPVCGYMGAKKRDKRLIGCFTLCNGLTMCWWFVMIVIVFVFLGVSTTDLGDGHNMQYYINEGMPVMEGCCTDLRKQKFAANGPVCSNPLGSIQLDVYALATDPDKKGLCKAEKDGDAASVESLSSPAFWAAVADDTSTDLSEDGSEGVKHKNVCLTPDDCDLIDDLKDSIHLSSGLFWLVAFCMLLACVPAILGCQFGYSLYKHPFMRKGDGLEESFRVRGDASRSVADSYSNVQTW